MEKTRQRLCNAPANADRVGIEYKAEETTKNTLEICFIVDGRSQLPPQAPNKGLSKVLGFVS
jgi:hypothetical protein